MGRTTRSASRSSSSSGSGSSGAARLRAARDRARSSSGSSGSSLAGYTSAIAESGITSSEWSSMNAASRAAVQQAAASGSLRSTGSGQSGAVVQQPTAQSITIVNRQGDPMSKYTAVTERFSVQNQAQAQVRGVAGPGSYEKRTLYKEDVRKNYYDFGSGKEVPIVRELEGRETSTPFQSSMIELSVGMGPRVEAQVIEQKDSSFFGAGHRVTETNVIPGTKAQAQLLTKNEDQPFGSASPVGFTITETVSIPSRLDQKLAPKVGGTFIGGVAKVAGERGTQLVVWAEPKIQSSWNKFGGFKAEGDTNRARLAINEGRFYKQIAGVGGFLQGFGETTYKAPSKIITGGLIGGGYVLLTRGAGAGAGAITGKGFFAAASRQTLIRTSQLATVTGVAATGIYAADVGVRFSAADGSAARGRVLGAEAPGLMGVFAGGKSVGTVITGVQQGRAVFLARGALGKPLTEIGVERLGRAADGVGGEVMVTGRSLKGVEVRSGAVSDQFGIRGMTEQQPILGKEQSFPLGEAPKVADYYEATGSGVVGRGSGGGQVIEPIDVTRVVTGGVATRAGSPRVSSYNYPELNTGETGITGTMSGEAKLYFSPVKGGVVRSTTGTGIAADTPFYRDFQSDLAFRRMIAGVEVIEMSPPQRAPGLRSLPGGSEPSVARSVEPSLFQGGETIVSRARPSAGNMGGLAKGKPDLPGYEFTTGGQRMKLLFEDLSTQTREPGGRGRMGEGGPFIVEGINIEGMGRSRWGGDFGIGRGTGVSVIGSVSQSRGQSGAAFGFGSVVGGKTIDMTGLNFIAGGQQVQASSLRSLTDQRPDTRQVTDQVTDQNFIIDPITKIDKGVDDWPDWELPEPPPPEVPFGGGFALPFGGGRQARGRGRAPRTRFKTGYNPSLAAEVFKIKGTKAQGRRAARTGIGVRPII